MFPSAGVQFSLGGPGAAAPTPCLRAKGGRYPDELYSQSCKVGTLLVKLQEFRDASDENAMFPSDLLGECESLLLAPSLFGGSRGFAALRGDKAVSAEIDGDGLDIPGLPQQSSSSHTAMLAPAAPQTQQQLNAQHRKEQWHNGILALADKYKISEKVAANFWLDANEHFLDPRKSKNKQELIIHYGGESSETTVAEDLYCMHRSHVLEALILLMKMRERYDDNEDSPLFNSYIIGRAKYEKVVVFTDKLLDDSNRARPGIIRILLEVIKTDTKKVSKSAPSSSSEHMQKLALALFHSCYQLQVNAEEEVEMMRVIKDLCRDVVADQPDQDDKAQKARQKGLQSALVILQVTYIHVLGERKLVVRPADLAHRGGNIGADDINSLFARISTQIKPFTWQVQRSSGNSRNINTVQEEKTLYRQLPGEPDPEPYWFKSSIVTNGLMYLIYGRMLHFIESDTKHVLDIFHEANERRAYSYIRLCMLPVLQTKNSFDSLNNSYATVSKVLKMFLFDLSSIFVDEIYGHDDAAIDPASYNPFFKTADERARRGLHATAGTMSGSFRQPPRNTLEDSPIGEKDTFIDVILLYTVFVTACTSFATQFLMADSQAFVFVHKVIQATHQPLARNAAFRFLTALASSPDKIEGGAPKRVYELLKSDCAPFNFNWDHFSRRLMQLAHRGSKAPPDPTHSAQARFAAASSFSELPGSSYRDGGWYQNDESSEISAVDEKEISSMACLYAAIGSQIQLQDVEDAIRPELIDTLFKLLACPLSIDTKGSIFRALAAYARNVPDEHSVEQVWRLLKMHRLLPHGTDYTDSPAGVSLHNKSLRSELEEIESRTGRYLITDGFLMLLEALMTRERAPRNQNQLYQPDLYHVEKADIMVFLEYVVEDILGEAETRFYHCPQSDSRNSSRQSSAQKWRIYARCFKVLSTILQYYEINALNSSAGTDDQSGEVLKSLRGDFPNEDGTSSMQLVSSGANQFFGGSSNNINGGFAVSTTAGSNPAARHIKSPGFMVMAMLLSKSKNCLQDSVMWQLRNSNFGIVQETDKLNKELAVFEAVRIIYMGRTSERPPPTKVPIPYLVEPEGVDDLGSIGFDESNPDCLYWHIKAITAATGLLYECLLRQKAFLEQIQNSPPISMALIRRSVLIQQPVAVQSLARTLAQYRYEAGDESALVHLSELLQVPNSICSSVPSIPVMACSIVKEVASDMSNTHLLLGVGSLGGKSAGDDLVRGCSNAIVEPNFPLSDDSGPFGGLVYPRSLAPVGFDVLPDVYTENPHVRLPVEPPQTLRTIERIKRTMRAASKYHDRSRPYFYGLDQNFETVRDKLLDLLVTTLSPNSPSFAHTLLGLEVARIGAVNPDDPLQAGSNLPSPGRYPCNCFEAVLSIMRHSKDLILLHPNQAMLCFELIYRLCAAPMTNLAILSYLRRSSPDGGPAFLPMHIEQCMAALYMSDQEILRVCGLSDEDGAPSHDAQERIAECLGPIKYARLNCCAWLLKICALEFRAISINHVSVSHLVDVIRKPLFEVLTVHDGHQGSRGDHITLVSILLAAADVPEARFPQFPDQLRRLVSRSQVPFSVARGGRNVKGFLVDKFLFRRLIMSLYANSAGEHAGIDRARYEEAERGITMLNRYIQHVAAAVHLLEGWNQCVGMALFCHKADFDRLVANLVLPTLSVLNSHDRLEAEMPDFLASAMFTMVSVLQARVTAPEAQGEGSRGRRSAADVLDTEQQRCLLQGLIDATINGAHRAGTSVRYRGHLIQCIGLVITCLSGFEDPSNVVGPTIREAVDPGDGGTERRDEPWGGLRNEDAETYRMQTLHLLEQNVTQLVDAVSLDACNGPVSSRLAAASTLQAILSALGPAKCRDSAMAAQGGRFKHVLGSHAFVQALQVLVHRGYLQQMLSIIGPVTGQRPALGSQLVPAGTDPMGEQDERELFISTVSLCVQVSCAVEGLDALIQHGGLMQRLLSLPIFVHPPPARDDIMRTVTGAAPEAVAFEDWEDMFLVVLRLLRTMAATSPTRHVLEGCAEFLRTNHASVTYLMRLKHKNIYGLALLEALMALVALVAAAPATPLRRSGQLTEGDRVEVRSRGQAHWRLGRITRDNRDQTFDVDFEDGPREQRVAAAFVRHCTAEPATAGILWDEALGRLADSFAADICKIVRVIGSFPYPSQKFTQMDEMGTGTWWIHIVPVSSAICTREKALMATLATGEANQGMLHAWSQFDSIKADLALKIVAHASAFLRKRAAVLIEHGLTGASSVGGGVLAVDVESVVMAFRTCSEILRKRVRATNGSVQGSVSRYLNIIAENLSCVIHDMVVSVAASDDELVYITPLIEQYADEASACRSDSFVAQVARVVQDRCSMRGRGRN